VDDLEEHGLSFSSNEDAGLEESLESLAFCGAKFAPTAEGSVEGLFWAIFKGGNDWNLDEGGGVGVAGSAEAPASNCFGGKLKHPPR
jgi:hypothetical protein